MNRTDSPETAATPKMKLFVAIELPEDLRHALAAIAPAETAGLRPVREDLLHLTLRFIGTSELEPVTSALGEVEMPESVGMRISGAGAFRGRRGMTVLWAGVEPWAGLLGLQKSVAARLREAGFDDPDGLAYHPHITLARCRMPKGQEKRRERMDLKRAIEVFLENQRGFAWPAFEISGFALFASEQAGGELRYRRLRSYPETGSASAAGS